MVGAVGVVIVGIGLAMVFEGVTKRFLKNLRLADIGPRARSVVPRLGMVGTTARGIVFGLAGILLIEAAVQRQSHKTRGLDGALMTAQDLSRDRSALSTANESS